MQAIMVCGLARSGKDTAADYIAGKYGYTKYTFSDVLREMLEEKGAEPTKQNMLGLGNKLRSEKGMDAVAKLLDRKIRDTGKVLLVGPRSMEEIEYFRHRFPEMALIKVSAKAEKRFGRRTKADADNRKKFFERDSADAAEKGLGKVIDAAEMEIKNDSTVKALCKKIDLFMASEKTVAGKQPFRRLGATAIPLKGNRPDTFGHHKKPAAGK
ncbi:AAA domain protein [uncultured archaeon]|nr:AAA domain protein [uncultured archaeon]